jgi:hypothetical protein
MGVSPNPAPENLRAFAEPKPAGAPEFTGFLPGSGQGRFGESRVVSLEDGAGTGYAARVTDGNDVGAEARYGEAAVTTYHVSVDTTTPTEILPETGRRRQFQIMNLDDTATVSILLGGTTPSTTEDWRIPPGGTYQLPPGIASGVKVYGKADVNTAQVVAIQFA